ncbi:LLM class flavin-dependent oxidoreductase [Microbacterium sp. NPDC055910]|uniref:LLM class flavin-dependent oxidoreductase n=1 Tax=Microbacterium sp. NPDC055910 TaxID=3345659 RepID=UPI0035D71D7A
MRAGITLSDVPKSRPPAEQFSDVQRIVAAAQEAGFRDIALGQHFLYGQMRWLQPVPLLARLAAEVDSDVRLITNVMIGPMYHPVLLAEELATLDIVTEGRFVFGVGIGYRPEEFDAFDVPFKERGARLDEMLQLMKMLWTQDVVDFEGRFWSLSGATPHIHPVQDPHPPIWVGGTAPAGARRAGRLGDGYIPNPEATADEVEARYRLVREHRLARGLEMRAMPLRRNIMLGSSIEDATSKYVALSQERYLAYASRGLDLYDNADLEAQFAETVRAHAILGTAQECVSQIADLAGRMPIETLMFRSQWTDEPTQGALDLVTELGDEVVPGISALPVLSDFPD